MCEFGRGDVGTRASGTTRDDGSGVKVWVPRWRAGTCTARMRRWIDRSGMAPGVRCAGDGVPRDDATRGKTRDGERASDAGASRRDDRVPRPRSRRAPVPSPEFERQPARSTKEEPRRAGT